MSATTRSTTIAVDRAGRPLRPRSSSNPKAAIEKLNEASTKKIKLFTAWDGSLNARLPRTGETILLARGRFNPDRKVTARDLALLCQEAQKAAEPAWALLQATLKQLGTLKTL